MAYLKCALNRKNASSTYDVLSPRTQSEVVFRPSGRTVEQDLAAYLPAVQGSDVVPNSLTQGKLLAGLTKAWIGSNTGSPIDLTQSDLSSESGLKCENHTIALTANAPESTATFTNSCSLFIVAITNAFWITSNTSTYPFIGFPGRIFEYTFNSSKLTITCALTSATVSCSGNYTAIVYGLY